MWFLFHFLLFHEKDKQVQTIHPQPSEGVFRGRDDIAGSWGTVQKRLLCLTMEPAASSHYHFPKRDVFMDSFCWDFISSAGTCRINFALGSGRRVLQNLMIIFLTGDHKVLLIIMIIKVIC